MSRASINPFWLEEMGQVFALRGRSACGLRGTHMDGMFMPLYNTKKKRKSLGRSNGGKVAGGPRLTHGVRYELGKGAEPFR